MFNSVHFFICWIVYTLIILFAWIFFYKKYSKGRRIRFNAFYAFLICVIFGYFAVITPDYYAYYSFIETVRKWVLPQDVETVYALLIPYLDYDYSLFRAIIVIPAFCLLFDIFRRYAINLQLCISLFILFNLLAFSTTIRSSLADGIFYIGAFAYIKERSVKSFALCVITTVLCCFFHKSAFMLIVPFLLSFLSIRKNIKVLIAIFPMAILIGQMVVSYVFVNYLDKSTYGSYQNYMSGSIMIRDYLQNIIFFILMSYTLWVSRDLLKYRKSFYTVMYKMVFFSEYIWLVCLCIGVSRYLPSRFLAHMIIPILLLVTYTCQSQNKRYLTTLAILGLAMIAVSEFGTLTTYREGVA